MNEIAKSIIVIGFVLVGVGIFLLLAGKIPGVGKLPGDIFIKKENFSFYFPISTCIVVSILLSLIMFMFSKK